MATVSLLESKIQKWGEVNAYLYEVTLNADEQAGFFLTIPRAGVRIQRVIGPCLYDVVDATKNKVFIYNYPIHQRLTIDDRQVTGLNDLAASGTYSGTDPAIFTVKISSAAASPDQFQWKKNDGSFSAATNMTGSAQSLSDGVSITFPATDGHTLNDIWVVTAAPATAKMGLTVLVKGT